MAEITTAFSSFEKLLPIKYCFILGRKGVTVTINLSFDKRDCFHLAGLQHLEDIAKLKRDRAKVFDEIISGKLPEDHLIGSIFYNQISRRVELLPLLEQIIDSNDTIFKYNLKNNVFSVISADFLLKNNNFEEITYLFLARKLEDNYCCKSFFPDNKHDYTYNQTSWTLLYKKKIDTTTNEEKILYIRDKFTPPI